MDSKERLIDESRKSFNVFSSLFDRNFSDMMRGDDANHLDHF